MGPSQASPNAPLLPQGDGRHAGVLAEATKAITPLILTFNEEDNIARVLERLSWAQRIVVVDSGSTDATLSILSRYPQVEVVKRPFDTFAAQCNFGLTQINTPWTLSLDADYVLSEALVAELQQLRLDGDIAGYSARFVYVVHGQTLRGALYPPRTVLYKTAQARYRNEGHGHRVELVGTTIRLDGVIHHDDRKPLSRWFSSQQRYASREALFLETASASELKAQDRLRRMIWPAPIAVFLYTLFLKGCVFDGWRGWFYALQRLIAECLLAIELLDRQFLRSERAAVDGVAGDGVASDQIGEREL